MKFNIKLNERQKNFITLLLIYIFLIINYRIIISQKFGYLGFKNEFYSLNKLILATSLTVALITLGTYIEEEFYKIVYNIFFVLLFLGQSIFYIFNESYFILVIYMSIPLVLLFVVDKLDKYNKNNDTKIRLSSKYTNYIFIISLIIMILPYLKYIKSVNLRNLIFKDIYDTRLKFRKYDNSILGYLFSPISRVIIPFMTIYAIRYKKVIIFFSSVIGLISMYLLNGALKSIYFGMIASLFFYRGSYFKKDKRFSYTIIALNIFSLLEFRVNKSYLIADYMRRIFFVPAELFQVYYDYFKPNPTYFLHSRISKLLHINKYEGSLSMFVGEQVIGKKGSNANIGIFAEGFLSFGSLGVIIASIIFVILIFYLKRRNLSPSYFGILFSYIYIINTSFIETLFLTHGLLFYLVFARYIIPKESDSNKCIFNSYLALK